MGRIQQCVRDVLAIANNTEDFGQAKTAASSNFLLRLTDNIAGILR